MAIIDTSTVKNLVGISGSTYDTQIGLLIPVVQDFIIEKLNNRFLDVIVQMSSSTLTFNNASPATITDSESKFVQDGDVLTYFYDGMDLDIFGSYRNDKIVNVETVAAGTLTLASSETLVTEDAESDNTWVVLTRVKWPDGIASIVADMIYWKLDSKRFLKSRGLGDYNESYIGAGGYPKELLRELRPWQRMKWA